MQYLAFVSVLAQISFYILAVHENQTWVGLNLELASSIFRTFFYVGHNHNRPYRSITRVRNSS